MNLRSYLFIVLLLTGIANGQDHVPTQKAVAIKQVGEYLRKVPKQLYQCTAHFLSIGKYHLFKSQAPHAFKIFSLNKTRNVPNVLHSFPWTNSGHHYKDVMTFEFGLCMGQTTAQRKFNILAFYDKLNAEKLIVPDEIAYPEKWLSFYKKRIDDIFEHRPAVFPGFENLQELGSHPKLSNYIKRKIVDEWADSNIGLGGIEILTGRSRQMSAEEVLKLYQDVQEKLNYNINPRLYFSAEPHAANKKKKWIHVMQVFKIEPVKPDGSYVMHIWDPNFPGTDAAKSVLVHSDGTIEYAGQVMGEVDLVPWENFELAEMISNMITFCEKSPKYCTDVIK